MTFDLANLRGVFLLASGIGGLGTATIATLWALNTGPAATTDFHHSMATYLVINAVMTVLALAGRRAAHRAATQRPDHAMVEAAWTTETTLVIDVTDAAMGRVPTWSW